MTQLIARKRRGLKTKARLKKSTRPRLVIYRSASHIYCQIVVTAEKGNSIIASASTLDKKLKETLHGSKVEQAAQVGRVIGERAKDKEISEVAFDRAGYKYHGRVKALANAAREAGLNF